MKPRKRRETRVVKKKRRLVFGHPAFSFAEVGWVTRAGRRWVRVGQLRSIGRVLEATGGRAVEGKRRTDGKGWFNRGLALYNYNANSAYTGYG